LIAEEGFDLAVLAVTDIAKHHSVVLAAGDRRLVGNLPFEEVSPGCFNAPGVVSRKKQLFPSVCQAVRRLG
jgi:manganese-dependent inorganic pyrophosphatase